jgi:predicted phage terminase large subunit-like protein|tara:strand:- start:717 stop:1817 length:1101 start_codon:yes stop_codon:yes gene_type:complete
LTGAMDLIQYCLVNDGVTTAVVAPTYGDLKRVVFSGDSGLVKLIPPELYGNKGYNKTDGTIEFYNGSTIIGIPAESFDRLRGINISRAWCDELASWNYKEAFDNLIMALRLGNNPKCIITTTPRPIALIKDLVKREDVQVIRGSTFENMDNLAQSSIDMFRTRYEGSTLGRQELYGEILEDVEGAMFNYAMIDNNRVEHVPDLDRIVVAIDPAVTSKESSDETGIIVAGRDSNNNFYVLNDSSCTASPDVWIKKALELYKSYDADRIVAEVNNGGDLIERLLRTQDATVPYQSVRATRGKSVRAEPICALYEQSRVHHVGLNLKDLEEQMCQFTGNNSKTHDDRVDALVWAITSLQNSGRAVFRIS